jgi:photosystem II stability/assembly factor-like uncharacterized protein
VDAGRDGSAGDRGPKGDQGPDHEPKTDQGVAKDQGVYHPQRRRRRIRPGSAGGIWKRVGSTWTQEAPIARFHDIARAGKTLFAVGSGGTVHHHDGASWSPKPAGTTSVLYAVWASAPDRAFAVGEAGTIICFDGASWKPLSSPLTNYALMDIRGCGGEVFAVGSYGTALRYK